MKKGNGGKWSVTCSDYIISGERDPQCLFSRRLVMAIKRKKSLPHLEMTSGCSPVASHFTDWVILAFLYTSYAEVKLVVLSSKVHASIPASKLDLQQLNIQSKDHISVIQVCEEQCYIFAQPNLSCGHISKW